jgi:predicted SPOUT superfamily RNA methylase MTH1
MYVDPGTRVTVKLASGDGVKRLYGSIVSPEEPKQNGTFWGYQVRYAQSMSEAFDQGPYSNGYDLKIGTSDKGDVYNATDYPEFEHAIICFGGLSGLEDILEAEEIETVPAQYFDKYINVCPQQGTRTIRTEEAVIITLATMTPILRP